jgi:sortase (surface protein transpeptidase)
MNEKIIEKIKKVAVATAMVIAFAVLSSTTVNALFLAPQEEIIEDETFLSGIVSFFDSKELPDFTSEAYDLRRNEALKHIDSQNVLRAESTSIAPSRIIIPSLSIDAHVQHVGLTVDLKMAAPTNFSDAGWYKYGPAPGQSGSAVIDGHVDNGLSLPGIFKNLNKMVKGDEISVVDNSGKISTFVVTKVITYDYQSVPNEMIFDPTGPPRLNLITCAGSFMHKIRTYDQRLVVFSELKE